MTAQLIDAFAVTPTKAGLIERINRARSALKGAIAGLGENVLATPGDDSWSVKDHLVHIECWERYLLAVLQRRSPGTAIRIDLATLRLTEDDPLNELIRELTTEQPLSQVLAERRRTHEDSLPSSPRCLKATGSGSPPTTSRKNWPTTRTRSPSGSPTSATST